MTDFFIKIYMYLSKTFNMSVYADENAGLYNPLAESGSKDLLGFLKTILSGLQPLLLVIIIVVFAYTGLKLISAKQKDNPESIAKAKNSIVFVLIGAFIILSGPSLIDFVQSVLESIGIATSEE